MDVSAMKSFPAGSNPFHHDHFRMGTQVNERFVAMYEATDSPRLVIVDVKTGRRIMIRADHNTPE
jgi:hypothetical protein